MTRSPQFRTVYANAYSVRITPNEAQITFSVETNDAQGQSQKTDEALVLMSNALLAGMVAHLQGHLQAAPTPAAPPTVPGLIAGTWAKLNAEGSLEAIDWDQVETLAEQHKTPQRNEVTAIASLVLGVRELVLGTMATAPKIR